MYRTWIPVCAHHILNCMNNEFWVHTLYVAYDNGMCKLQPLDQISITDLYMQVPTSCPTFLWAGSEKSYIDFAVFGDCHMISCIVCPYFLCNSIDWFQVATRTCVSNSAQHDVSYKSRPLRLSPHILISNTSQHLVYWIATISLSHTHFHEPMVFLTNNWAYATIKHIFSHQSNKMS